MTTCMLNVYKLFIKDSNLVVDVGDMEEGLFGSMLIVLIVLIVLIHILILIATIVIIVIINIMLIPWSSSKFEYFNVNK